MAAAAPQHQLHCVFHPEALDIKVYKVLEKFTSCYIPLTHLNSIIRATVHENTF